MCLCIDAGGAIHGKGTHLSVFLYLMKGSHDDELTWPLRGKFDMKLLNHFRNSGHYSKTLTYDDDNIPHKSRSKVTQHDRASDGWGIFSINFQCRCQADYPDMSIFERGLPLLPSN